MKIQLKVAASALLVFTLFPAVAAHAQTDCARADYCNPDTPDSGGSDEGSSGQPGGVIVGGPAGEETSRGGAGGAAGEDGAEVLGAESEAPTDADAVGAEAGAAAATAPSGSLPITGGDVVGIAALGAVAVGLGTVLVKRSKAARQPA